MKRSPAFEFPPEQCSALKRARRLEWITVVYLISVVVLQYFVLGSSQTMKTAWLEDLLSIIPPAVFLIATKVCHWEPTDHFPYGYHKAVSIAFLCASLALLGTGAFLLIDSGYKLMQMEHPTIGSVRLFGTTIWLGWLMIPTLIYGSLPAVFLGHAKLPLAETMHDKVLHADADMNKANWMSGISTVAGILGVAFGYWWMDAAAGALISWSILHDGYTNLREVVSNLMDEVPKTTDHARIDPLPQKVKAYLESLPWVQAVDVRMREEGHVYFGEAFVVCSDDDDLVEKINQATDRAGEIDWRVHDFVITPVPSLQRSNQTSKETATASS